MKASDNHRRSKKMLLLTQCYLNFWNIATFTLGLGGSFTPPHLCQPLWDTNHSPQFKTKIFYCLFAGFILYDEGIGSFSLHFPVSSVASAPKWHVTLNSHSPLVESCAPCSVRDRSSVPACASWPWISQDKTLITLWFCWEVVTCYTLLVNNTDDLLNEAESNFWQE